MSEPLSNYIPLVKGKYITYRLDSLVFVDFQRVPETHRYQVKHVIDDSITDNLGRPTFRVYTYLRDSAGTTSWTPNGTYFITRVADQVEVVENNLRFIKLHLPIKEGFSWKGNKYFPPDPFEPFGFTFSNDNNIKDWEYNYDSFESFTYNGKTYTDVTTVEEADISDNVPITLPNVFATKTRSVERYSKNIGLVYRDYTLWEYQPNPNGNPFYVGFGTRMWMIDHN
ncbi:MAG: hypothetical protein ABIR18_13955 [Chitinophagaceae bacterium]